MDQWVGSLEPGKDADFAIWSKSPLDSGIVCLQTWIDGKKYFDRSLNADRVARLKKERDDLLAKQQETWSFPRVELTDAEEKLWHWGAFLGLPIAFMYLGMLMWFVRRMR